MIRHKVRLVSNQMSERVSLMKGEFLTPAEVAAHFHKHRKTVLRWKGLPWMKLSPRTFLMRQEDLERFEESKCRETT